MLIFRSLTRSIIRFPSRMTVRTFARSVPRFNEIAQMSLDDLAASGKIDKSILSALQMAKFTTLTPVQSRSLVPIIDEEKGVVVRAKTGTGKTLAFVVPTLQCALNEPFQRTKTGKGHVSVLVIAPTRDLALQIEQEYLKVIKHLKRDQKEKAKILLLMGGRKTDFDFRAPPSIVIATPGRLQDKLSNPKFARQFAHLKYRVYDEADRILDVGFKDSLDEIDRLLKDIRAKEAPELAMFKSVLFSATVDDAVTEFAHTQMGAEYNYIDCVDESEGEAHENIFQTLVATKDTSDTYSSALSFLTTNLNDKGFKAIVFLPTITGVEWFASVLGAARESKLYDTDVHSKWRSRVVKLNGKMSQAARDRSVRFFRQADHGILICTDVAARGLDFNDVSHVIQLSPSPEVADYIHKVGRTARAGAKGKALIFLTKNEMKFKNVLQKQRGIKFAEEITSDDIEQVEDVFGKISMEEESIESFLSTYLSFQKQISSVFRLNFEGIASDAIAFYRLLLKDPEAKLHVSRNYVQKILNLDGRFAEDLFSVPGGFNFRTNNNRSAKRSTFDRGYNQKSYGDKPYRQNATYKSSSYNERSGSRNNGSYGNDRSGSYGNDRSYGNNRSFNNRSNDRNDKGYNNRSNKSYSSRNDRNLPKDNDDW